MMIIKLKNHTAMLYMTLSDKRSQTCDFPKGTKSRFLLGMEPGGKGN
ncbi:putative SH3-domain-containing protein [Candida albicans P78042]|nr:putative SH3-domain-containing protein [Candida albicans P57055]KHC84286.1 putative SH3-domain-containing protein [Candida albicans P78042]RLP62156.1 hypothetical protein L150_00850 [Candida albicans Ca529L]